MFAVSVFPGATGLSKHHIQRLALSAAPAALVTLGLFSFMQATIKVDEFSPPDVRTYTLEAYLAVEERIDEPVETVRPDRDLLSAAPPPAPPIDVIKTPVTINAGDYFGSAPREYGHSRPELTVPRGIGAVIDRTLKPLRPPLITYPEVAAIRGLEGSCEVSFSVTPKGDPYDVVANCSDSVFEKAAASAVKNSQFAPKILNGQAVTVTGVVYPIVFSMEQ